MSSQKYRRIFLRTKSSELIAKTTVTVNYSTLIDILGCPGAQGGLQLEKGYHLQWEADVLLTYMHSLRSTFFKSTLWD